MGIDARILIRLRGDKPTDDQLARWSDAICRSIGANHFFIQDGMPPSEYHAKIASWHQVYKNRGRDAAGPAPTCRRRAIELTNTQYPLEPDDISGTSAPSDAIEPGRCYVQDGPDVYAEPGEWFLTVSVWSRYYGKGYERGDLLVLCAVAEWVEQNIDSAEVWYGGDSIGVCVEPWPESERRKLRQHMFGPEGNDYFERGAKVHPKPCSLCVDGGRFSECGWGAQYLAVSCAGCGKNFETRDGGQSWKSREVES